MLLTFVYCLCHYVIVWSKCSCSPLSKFASDSGRGEYTGILWLIRSHPNDIGHIHTKVGGQN